MASKRVKAVTIQFDDGSVIKMSPESHDAVFSTVTYASRDHNTSNRMHIRSEVHWVDDVRASTKGRNK